MGKATSLFYTSLPLAVLSCLEPPTLRLREILPEDSGQDLDVDGRSQKITQVAALSSMIQSRLWEAWAKKLTS